MKTTLLFKTILAFALCGLLFAEEEYTISEILEPEDMAEIYVPNEVDAPAKIIPSVKTEEDSLILPGDIPVKPPKLMQMDGQLVLVQYSSRSQKQQPAAPPAPELPQQQDFNTMNETERLETLQKSIQAVLRANTGNRRGMNMQNHTPHDVLLMSLPYGADARVFRPNPNVDPRDRNAPKGDYIYSMGVLCWNMPCNGKTLLRSDGTKVIARVGSGYQRQPAMLAAAMAMSHVVPDYELKLGNNAYTLAHLIASERMAVSKGMNLSMALVALSFYGESKDQWKNELDETWDIEKMVTNELNRSLDQGTPDVTDWLLGLTAAVKLYESENRPVRGPLALAKKQLQTYHDFVLSIQNDRYLWHPKFFLYKGFNPNAFETMYSSGHILRWLVYSLPDKELQNPQVVRSVMSLTTTVNRVKPETMANAMSPKELEGLAVSLHALSVYYQRTFGELPNATPAAQQTVAVR